MSDIPLICLLQRNTRSPGPPEDDTDLQQRVAAAAVSLGCRLHVADSANPLHSDIRALRPDVILIPARCTETGSITASAGASSDQDTGWRADPATDAVTLCRRIRDDAVLRDASLLLLLDEAPHHADWPLHGPDDFLLRAANRFEVTVRIQAALRFAQMRRQATSARLALEQRDAQDTSGGYSEDATTQLVEIAALLQSEVCHSVEREVASVREAQSDTIAQAAAALRHEINNPLFAILGSGESALRRLRGMKAGMENARVAGAGGGSEADIAALIACLERMQRGGERIEQVVQTISAMLTPATTDYVPGVSMLNLNASNNSG